MLVTVLDAAGKIGDISGYDLDVQTIYKIEGSEINVI